MELAQPVGMAAFSDERNRLRSPSMLRYKINDPELVDDADGPEGFHTAYDRFGKRIGGMKLGATLYLVRPGQRLCPYHYEYRGGVAPGANHADVDARVLMWSTVSSPAVVVYPDSDTIAADTREEADRIVVRRSSGVDYWAGETGLRR